MAVMAKTASSDVKKNLFLKAGPRQNLPLNILLVDDSTVVHRMLAHRFKMLNWKMTSLYNGAEAVKLYEKTGFQKIDMILMDKEMPVMTGETATEKLVQMGCQIPIVALTSCSENLDEFVIRGAMGVLNKPLQIPNLLQTLLRTRAMKVDAENLKKQRSPTKGGSAHDAEEESKMVTINPDVQSWTPEEVCRWLPSLGHAYMMYATAFRYHGIAGKTLLRMSEPKHFEMLGVTTDLHQKGLKNGINELNEHMATVRPQIEDKAAEEPSTAAAATATVTESLGTLQLGDEAFVEKLCNRYTGDQFSDVVVSIVSKALPRLTEDARQKIQLLLKNAAAVEEEKSAQA